MNKIAFPVVQDHCINTAKPESIPAYQTIQTALDGFEHKVLYAVQSGSRAYGLNNNFSDFDCRFIFVKERRSYLSIDVENQKTTKEIKFSRGVDPVGLDVVGVDLRKALKLLLNSNPTVVEWVVAKECFTRVGELHANLIDWLDQHYSVRAGFLAAHNTGFSRYMKGVYEQTTIKPKELVEVVRCVLTAEYHLSYNGVAPIKFEELQHLIPPAYASALSAVVEKRRMDDSASMRLSVKDPEVDSLIHYCRNQFEIYRGVNLVDPSDAKSRRDALDCMNDIFHATVSSEAR